MVIFNPWRTSFWILWRNPRSFCRTLLWNGFSVKKKKEKLKKKVLLISLAILKDELVAKNTVGYQYRKVNVFADFELDLFYTMLVAMRKMVENAIVFAENNQSLWHCVCRFRFLLCALLWGMIPNVLLLFSFCVMRGRYSQLIIDLLFPIFF